MSIITADKLMHAVQRKLPLKFNWGNSITLSGTVVSGKTYTTTFTSASITGGTPVTVSGSSSDTTLGTTATAIATSINGNGSLTGAGITAVAVGAIVFLQYAQGTLTDLVLAYGGTQTATTVTTGTVGYQNAIGTAAPSGGKEIAMGLSNNDGTITIAIDGKETPSKTISAYIYSEIAAQWFLLGATSSFYQKVFVPGSLDSFAISDRSCFFLTSDTLVTNAWTDTDVDPRNP